MPRVIRISTLIALMTQTSTSPCGLFLSTHPLAASTAAPITQQRSRFHWQTNSLRWTQGERAPSRIVIGRETNVAVFFSISSPPNSSYSDPLVFLFSIDPSTLSQRAAKIWELLVEVMIEDLVAKELSIDVSKNYCTFGLLGKLVI